jgi:uncharacterized protein
MKFEWDEKKNQANLANHQLDFVDASKVFRMPLRISLDERQDYGEERWIGIGLIDGRVVVLVFTEPDERTIRIISLRKALPYERKVYEQYLKNRLGEG